jgi:hypothetical protein
MLHQIMKEALSITDEEYKLKRSSTGTVVSTHCTAYIIADVHMHYLGR